MFDNIKVYDGDNTMVKIQVIDGVIYNSKNGLTNGKLKLRKNEGITLDGYIFYGNPIECYVITDMGVLNVLPNDCDEMEVSRKKYEVGEITTLNYIYKQSLFDIFM